MMVYNSVNTLKYVMNRVLSIGELYGMWNLNKGITGKKTQNLDLVAPYLCQHRHERTPKLRSSRENGRIFFFSPKEKGTRRNLRGGNEERGEVKENRAI